MRNLENRINGGVNQMNNFDIISAGIGAFLGLAIGLAVLFFAYKNAFDKGVEHRKNIAEAEIGSAEAEKVKIIAESHRLGEAKKREFLLEAKEEIHRSRVELERELRERRNEIQKTERRLLQKDETLDKKIENLEQKEENLNGRFAEIQVKEEQITKLHKSKLDELEKISGMSSEQAKDLLLHNIENEITHEAAMIIKNVETKTKEEADNKAREIVVGAIQRCAVDHVSETTVSVVALPNDEMKGRIIGREGRNIRTLETLTGIDLIIDDTPEAVILSGFDPIRREIARLALEKLILDGRIHPARIEEMIEKSKKEVENTIRVEGDRVAFETGIIGLHPELIKILGKLKYRTSYGQNVLNHSIEVAHLTGLMAAELGLDVVIAKRAGLLHDIGKAVDFEMEGTHISLGADLAKKYKENEIVINSIMSHHGDAEPTSMIAVLVQAADTISASRPGARRETVESYIKRIEKLEDIANSFDCVEKSFAIQAGREIRILIKPENISDDEMVLKAREIVKKIEDELEYPGQIKVHLIRETRSIEYAK